MSKTILRLKELPTAPLEAEALSPDILAGLSHDQVGALAVHLGNRQRRLDEFFSIEGEGSADLEIHGDLSRVKWLGKGMSRGRIVIAGNAGMHVGAHMKGGTIEVRGNASDWIGAEMRGGLIHIAGNAGGQVGAAYRGGLSGMNGGTILIEGKAGVELGMRMRRGIIAVRGMVQDFAGLQMKGGTIVLAAGAEARTGAWMRRGTIITLEPIALLPTFAWNCIYDPTFIRLYARHLQPLGFSIPFDVSQGAYARYSGDAAVPGKGEILVWQAGTGGS